VQLSPQKMSALPIVVSAPIRISQLSPSKLAYPF
jgi:hypothetical protein